jgi:hypothetical protein
MDRIPSRSVSKGSENIKGFFNFFQFNNSNNNHEEEQSRSNSIDGQQFRTENNFLRSLLSRIANELNIDQKQKFASILSNPDKMITIDTMLDLQQKVLSSITTLKQASSHDSFTIDDDGISAPPETSLPHLSTNFPEDAPNLIFFDWQICNEIHAPPPFDLDSPVVTHILQTWTVDKTKVEFLMNWVFNLSTTNYDAVPIGIQITSISKVLR